MQTAYSNEKPADLQPVMQAVAHSSLRQLVEKARLLLKLDRFVQAWLPTELKSHCHVMNLNQQTLVLGLDNAAWVTRMQFISSDLMDALKKESDFPVILNVRCRVIKKSEPLACKCNITSTELRA